MIRFCENMSISDSHVNVVVLPESVVLDDSIWDKGKELFKKDICIDITNIRVIPVKNRNQEVICYAYQDDEANRELRMLRELETYKEVLHFDSILGNTKEVIVCGCNELAYRFVKYLEKQEINVSVIGKYWDYFGYENHVDLYAADKFVVYAEGNQLQVSNLYQMIIRSASPEFECIDRIYEANVKTGKIKDTIGDCKEFLKKLNGKDVVILGTDVKAQDTYDFLYANGIDIYCFAEWNLQQGRMRTLLGKEVIEVDEIIRKEKNLVFINTNDRSSALGCQELEFFDYYGYVRNEDFFLINDYTDVPCNNLIHVLKGKEVWITGDEMFCMLLANYLRDVEQEDINVKYVRVSQCVDLKSVDILCVVYPWYGARNLLANPKFCYFREKLVSMKNISYTDYFSCAKVFVAIDLYMNRNKEKYTLKQLTPKGILLGRIPAASGNFFFRGIIDGHPEILKWGYNMLNNNLFLYCVCLAHKKSQDVLKAFKKILMEEYIHQLKQNIDSWDNFENSAKRLLSLKDKFSSQELFIIFHIAYAEMMSDKQITDVCDKVIYWEPHKFPRNEFPFLAQWLEDEKINGLTIYMHRDNIVWTGSCYKFYKENPSSLEFIYAVARNDFTEEDEISYQHWSEFHMRFEDIKLHPHRELMRICDMLGISWSDTMLKTTNDGEAWDYQGVMDFDIKPVFNKYEEYLSEFDRFRISLISSPYQKLYGYTYENCLKFSRRELEDMFLKKFRFQERLQFESEKDSIEYYFQVYDLMRQNLWKARKHEVLGDIVPKFDQMDIGQSISPEELDKRIPTQKEIEKLVEYVIQTPKLILYGIGRDCEALLSRLNENRSELLFCDTIATYKETFFHGNNVISPAELCEYHDDYKILITSSEYYKDIQHQLIELLGISPDRIICNTFRLWEEEK